MKLTNKFNLPKPLVDAVTQKYFNTNKDQISATSLIDSPLIRQLRLKHFEEIEEDVSERIWMLLGNSVHSILETSDTFNHFSEEFISVPYNGMQIRGKADLLDSDGVLSDYKVTSVYSFILGDKDEWHKQLNVYAWLFNKLGIEVKKLQIVAILRDWSQMKAKIDKDGKYPPCPVKVKKIKLMPILEIEKYIDDRLALHKLAGGGEPPECTPAERWEKPHVWAVKKTGNKRSLKNYYDKEEAEKHLKRINTEGKHEIEFREGINVKCEDYCSVRKMCPYRQKDKNPF